MSDLSPTFTTLRLRRSAWTAPALLADSALVVIGLILATAIRQALDPVLHPAVPFATYYLVTVLLGCIWSMRAGITSLFLGLMTGSYFFVDPAGSVIPRNAGGWAGEGFFLLTGGVVLLLAELQWKARGQSENNAARARAAEEEVSHREHLFKALVLASNQCVWHYKPGREMLRSVDEAHLAWWRDFTGQSDEERTARDGAGWLDAVHEADREIAGRHWETIASMSQAGAVDFRARRRDGAWRWLCVTPVPIEDEQGAIIEWVGAVADVTEQRTAAQQRDRHVEEIEALNERLRQAMRETHHRVKNNLQVVSALVDIQAMTHEDEAVPIRELKRIGHHIRTLAAIHDLLTHNAVGAGDSERIYSCDIMSKLEPLMRSIVGERQIRFDVENMPLAPRQSTSLAILVNELVNNAVKHGTGDIEVSLAVVSGRARLAVSDRGPGFDDGFDPHRSANTGIDLIENLSRHDLQGTTAYENREEGGARVVVEFPRR